MSKIIPIWLFESFEPVKTKSLLILTIIWSALIMEKSFLDFEKMSKWETDDI